MPGTANSGGRNRKSKQQHQLEGTFQRSRHDEAKAPEPPKGRPVPPKGLEGEAAAEWERMVSRMEASKTLSVVDDAALFQYVQLFAETEALSAACVDTARLIDKAEDAMRELEGAELVEAIREMVKLKQLESRYSTQIRQGRMAVRQYLVEFGMTPSARARVKPADGDDANDPWSEFDGSVN